MARGTKSTLITALNWVCLFRIHDIMIHLAILYLNCHVL